AGAGGAEIDDPIHRKRSAIVRQLAALERFQEPADHGCLAYAAAPDDSNQPLRARFEEADDEPRLDVAILEIERRDTRRRIDEAGDAAHGLRRLALALDPSGDSFFHTLGDLLGILDELLLIADLELQICEIAFDPRPLGRVLC